MVGNVSGCLWLLTGGWSLIILVTEAWPTDCRPHTLRRTCTDLSHVRLLVSPTHTDTCTNTHLHKHTKKNPQYLTWAVTQLTFCPGCFKSKLYLVAYRIRWQMLFLISKCFIAFVTYFYSFLVFLLCLRLIILFIPVKGSKTHYSLFWIQKSDILIQNNVIISILLLFWSLF